MFYAYDTHYTRIAVCSSMNVYAIACISIRLVDNFSLHFDYFYLYYLNTSAYFVLLFPMTQIHTRIAKYAHYTLTHAQKLAEIDRVATGRGFTEREI